MSAPTRPPRWAEWILARALPRGLSADGVMGDLEEELRLRAARGSPASARRWYARQAIAIAARVLAARVTGRDAWDAAASGAAGAGLGSAVARDVAQGVRSLGHAPAFVALTALTLALGVAATTAIFSVVDGVLLRPLPYLEPDRLVISTVQIGEEETGNHSEPEILDLMKERASFAAVAAYRTSQPLLGEGPEPERVRCILATASLLDVLGARPMLGRFYTPAEALPDSPEAVAVLSHGLWVRRFGSDPDIIGKTVLFENIPHTVVGVMSADFSFPSPGIEVWRPLRIDAANPVARNNHYLTVIARLAEGASLESVASRLRALGARSTDAYPEFYAEPMSFVVRPMHEDLVRDVRSPLLLLMGAVAVVLLAAAVNAASLFLARGQRRRAEIAVRTALGAARSRVATQLLAESVIVAGLAAAVGIALAYSGVALLARVAPPDLPRIEQVAVDGRVLAFGLAVSLLTGVLFGLVPAGQAWKSDVCEVLGGARGGVGTRRGARFRRGLVVTQLALATMLALGAGLVVRSFGELRQVDLGFRPEGVLVVPLAPHVSAVAPDQDAVRFYGQLEERIAALPGVAAVGSGLTVPLVTGHSNYSIQLEGREVATIGESPAPGMEWVTPGYFDAMGIRLLRGRLLTPADDEAADLVAVIGEATARELWPGEDALGKRLRLYNPVNPWMEIVGIVSDVRHYGVRSEASAMLYIPHRQGFRSGLYSPSNLNVFVRGAPGADPTALAGPVQATIRELEPRMPIGAVRTMEDVVGGALGPDRFTLGLLAALAAGALLLAGVGVYGVVAEAVASRTREIGLRMAVGAARTRILRQVLREALVLAGWGTALGLGGSLAFARLLETVLYEVSPLDPLTYLAAAPALVTLVVAASLVPALRAARLDPVAALQGG